MPREIMHWAVLEGAIRELSSSKAPGVKSCLSNNCEAARLGAIAHDAPYYHRFGGSHFENVAEMLHGTNGENTVLPLIGIAEHIVADDPSDQALWAFLIGMFSHFVADICFHPMIYYFTGNYNDDDLDRRAGARTGHRLLEVYLDSWCREQLRSEGGIYIWDLLRVLGGVRFRIFRLLNNTLTLALLRSDSSPPQSSVDRSNSWRDSFYYMAILQRCFFSAPLGAALSIMNRVTLGRLKGIDALFSYGRTEAATVFDSPLDFRNPVTGERRVASVREIYAKAVSRCVEIFERFEPLVGGEDSDPSQLLGVIVGESLNFSGINHPTSEARFFSRIGLDLPGLRLE